MQAEAASRLDLIQPSGPAAMAAETQHEQTSRMRYLVAVLVMMAGPGGSALLAWLATLLASTRIHAEEVAVVPFVILLYVGVPATIATVVVGLVMVVRTAVARRRESWKSPL
ncbi:MAG: hypothetical protein ACT4UP_10810 [Gammaproteobacteria bacterium]